MSGSEEEDWEKVSMKTVIPPDDTMDPDDTRKPEGTGKSKGDTRDWFGDASPGKSGKSGEESGDGYNYNQLGPDLMKRIEGPEKRDPETEALRNQEEKDIKKAPYLKGAKKLTEGDLGRSTKSFHYALEDAQKKQEEEDARKEEAQKKEAQKKPKDDNVMLRFY